MKRYLYLILCIGVFSNAPMSIVQSLQIRNTFSESDQNRLKEILSFGDDTSTDVASIDVASTDDDFNAAFLKVRQAIEKSEDLVEVIQDFKLKYFVRLRKYIEDQVKGGMLDDVKKRIETAAQSIIRIDWGFSFATSEAEKEKEKTKKEEEKKKAEENKPSIEKDFLTSILNIDQCYIDYIFLALVSDQAGFSIHDARAEMFSNQIKIAQTILDDVLTKIEEEKKAKEARS